MPRIGWFMVGIAYLGPEGTFTHTALIAMVTAGVVDVVGSGPPDLNPVHSTPAAVQAVRDGDADYACVPIENSVEGSVLPTLDSLARGLPLRIYAEITLDVAFSIVTRPGMSLREVRTVAAFPVAAAQVRYWLAENLPHAEVVTSSSNAAAAADVAGLVADAGVSTAWAGQRYGLTALAEGVVDEPDAQTRFVLVSSARQPPPRTGADRTSVVVRLDNVPGALAGVMNEFGMRGIDLLRIESRPTRSELGTYLFFIDCRGHIDDAAVAEVLKALYRRCCEVRYLGSWPTGALLGACPPPADAAAQWLHRLRTGGSD